MIRDRRWMVIGVAHRSTENSFNSFVAVFVSHPVKVQ